MKTYYCRWALGELQVHRYSGFEEKHSFDNKAEKQTKHGFCIETLVSFDPQFTLDPPRGSSVLGSIALYSPALFDHLFKLPIVIALGVLERTVSGQWGGRGLVCRLPKCP